MARALGRRQQALGALGLLGAALLDAAHEEGLRVVLGMLVGIDDLHAVPSLSGLVLYALRQVGVDDCVAHQKGAREAIHRFERAEIISGRRSRQLVLQKCTSMRALSRAFQATPCGTQAFDCPPMTARQNRSAALRRSLRVKLAALQPMRVRKLAEILPPDSGHRRTGYRRRSHTTSTHKSSGGSHDEDDDQDDERECWHRAGGGVPAGGDRFGNFQGRRLLRRPGPEVRASSR